VKEGLKGNVAESMTANRNQKPQNLFN